ncbi:SDR family oxidoreductase [Pseudonocardia sp. DLS-67]
MAAPIEPQAVERVGEPDEVGFAVTHLCSDRAAFVTGAALPVDGGYAAQALGRASGGSTPQSISWSVSSPGVMS